MAEEKKRISKHTLSMQEREHLHIGGVLEVMSFDEEGVIMETSCGLLLIKGLGLHIGRLDLDTGEVSVEGTIDSLTYSDNSFCEKHSFLSKLFR